MKSHLEEYASCSYNAQISNLSCTTRKHRVAADCLVNQFNGNLSD